MRIGAPGQEKPVVRLDESTYVDVSDVAGDFDEAFFARGGLAELAQVVIDRQAAGQTRPFAGERPVAPLARPHQILFVLLNAAALGAVSGQPVPEDQIRFTRTPSALLGRNDYVRARRGVT